MASSSPLHKAAISGNIPELQQLLAGGADINSYDENIRQTPLIAACLSPDAGVDVLAFLIDHGADVHAREQPDLKQLAAMTTLVAQNNLMSPECRAEMDATLEAAGITAEMRAMVEQCQQKFLKDTPEEPTLIALAVQNADCAKIRLLIERGADLNYRSPHGYTLLMKAAFRDQMDVIELLLAAGAPVDGESTYRESALRTLSKNGRFQTVTQLLDSGADPAELEWTPLLRGVALGTLLEVKTLLDDGADPEARDFWERTAFLISIQTGDTEKAALILASGADRHATGRCAMPAACYPIIRDDTRMLEWLIDEGFDVNQENQFRHTALTEAAENSAPGCFRLLLEASGGGVDTITDDLISNASHPEILGLLYEHGADMSKLEAEVLRDFIGLGNTSDLPVSKTEYSEARTRKFGNANPERMNVPFWRAMVRCGWSGYQAAEQFGDTSFGRDNPVWCHQRFGMSLTRLPDGRFIQIAGEHEDHYDPDFCIYNDVIIHDGQGGFEILGYPEKVFPPTDFHSATFVEPWIYIIGNLGYHGTRGSDTPVYRWHKEIGVIERVSTRGPSPGWIHRHRAVLEGGCIRVSGGEIFTEEGNGEGGIFNHEAGYLLDLATMEWRNADDS
ncbi:MAG: ankyrin repeat domain-containing protein [Luteolibacter sp.]